MRPHPFSEHLNGTLEYGTDSQICWRCTLFKTKKITSSILFNCSHFSPLNTMTKMHFTLLTNITMPAEVCSTTRFQKAIDIKVFQVSWSSMVLFCADCLSCLFVTSLEMFPPFPPKEERGTGPLISRVKLHSLTLSWQYPCAEPACLFSAVVEPPWCSAALSERDTVCEMWF